MKPRSTSHRLLQLACVAALCAGGLAHAQANRSVRAAPQPAAPSGASALGAPNPAGLQSRFPAGLPSPSANPAGLPDPTVPNVSVPGVPPGSAVVDPGVQQAPVGGYGAPTRPVAVAATGSYTPQQIAGSFIGADGNRDGELTRAEAQKLTIAPYSFEEMDANHDDILTRSEYENAFR